MIGVDLFSGAGGMSLGAKLAGIDVQYVVEKDTHSARTYLHNHQPKNGLLNDDIRAYRPRSFYGRENKGLIVFGGPPCQGFSTSNQRTRSKENDFNWLYKEFIRVVRDLAPDCFVFENVRGLTETEQGFFFEKILEDFSKTGYSISWDILNSANFGVPQNRSRLFIVGLRGGASRYIFPIERRKRITVGQALIDLPSLENGASVCFREYARKSRNTYAKLMRSDLNGCRNNIVTRNSSLIVERYKHVPQGGNWESIPDALMKNYADKERCHTGIYRRLSESAPSVVIGNFRKNMLIHPKEDRGLSVREAARLQSFPDSFEFLGSIGFQQQQVGNAVPPLLAKVVFKQIMAQV